MTSRRTAQDTRPRLPADRTTPDGRAATKADRRAQLLDAAAWLVTEKGLVGFTMEGLAASAGVSKALPYRHFANSDTVLVALMQREVGRLGRAMTDACDGLNDGDSIMRAAIGAYFETVAARGGLLNALVGPGSPIPELAGRGARQPAPFLVALLERGYGLTGRSAVITAWLVTGLAIAGSDSVGRGDGPRTTIESATVAAVISSVHAVIETTSR